MKRFLLATTAILALGASASAADLGARGVAPMAPAPAFVAYNWSGFYVGVNAGGAKLSTDVYDPDYWYYGGTLNRSKFGGIVGAQLGFNMQSGSFVYGLEGDLSALAGTKNSHFYSGEVTIKNDMPWLATVRVRAGLAVGNTLVYATGGVAAASVKHSWYETSESGALRTSDTAWGYAVGGGVEHAFSPNWTFKIEALYVDLEESWTNYGNNAGFFSDTTRFGFQNKAVIGRVGLNYKFGSSAGAPVMARY
jgi:outer membrane immunogenic protein